MKLHITIDIDEADLARLLGYAGPIAAATRPPAGTDRPADPPRPAGTVQLDSAGNAGCPAPGRPFYDWLVKNRAKDRALGLAKSWKFPGKIMDWSHDQVVSVYEEITRKVPAQPDRRPSK